MNTTRSKDDDARHTRVGGEVHRTEAGTATRTPPERSGAAAEKPPLDPDVAQHVAKVDMDFRTNMPAAAFNATSYTPPPPPEGTEPMPIDKTAVRVPAGRYRVQGSDWAFDFKGGSPDYVLAFKPQPPDYGGDDVIGVAPILP